MGKIRELDGQGFKSKFIVQDCKSTILPKYLHKKARSTDYAFELGSFLLFLTDSEIKNFCFNSEREAIAKIKSLWKINKIAEGALHSLYATN